MEDEGCSSSASSSSPLPWRSRAESDGARNRNKVRCETDLQQRWRKMKTGDTANLELPLRPGKMMDPGAPSWRRRQQSGPVNLEQHRECLPGDWTIRGLLSKLLVAAPAVDVDPGPDAMSSKGKMAKKMKKKSIRFVKVKPEDEAAMMATAPASPVVNCVGQVSRKKTLRSEGFFGTPKSS